MKDSEYQCDYNSAVEIGDGIFWVGFYDSASGLHCNPYLVMEDGEAVVIDGGSRPDFPTVMLKILQTGIDLRSIRALICQHYDPDLCGSLANFEDLIDSPDLIILSHPENNIFIRHYSTRTQLVSHESIDSRFRFSSGRTLRFINTPYAHSAGSFMTFDERTGTLFTSDLFGSYGAQWELVLHLDPECRRCRGLLDCPLEKPYCPLPDIENFHRRIMTSEKALRHAMRQVDTVPVSLIAPQHGSIIDEEASIRFVIELLAELTGVGIDGIAS